MHSTPSLPRVFISFASEDDDARLELGRELNRHGIDTYDYSIPHLGSQVGMTLEDQIAAEIDRASLVIALISDASTSPMKAVVHAEVERASAREDPASGRHFLGVVLRAPRAEGEPRRAPPYFHCVDRARLPDLTAFSSDTKIRVVAGASTAVAGVPQPTTLEVRVRDTDLPCHEFPVFVCDEQVFLPEVTWKRLMAVTPPFVAEMLKGACHRTWMGAFARLQQRAWTHVDVVGPNCFNGLGRIVCERLGLNYQRPAPADVRLPFYLRLHEEIWDLPNHLRESVLGQMDFFSAWVPTGGWEDALANLMALRSLLRLHGRDSRYARVIQGVCLLRLGRPARALDLMDEFLLGDEAADENVWGVRSKALHALGRWCEALEAARYAVKFCKKNGDPAPHARIDWVTLALECLSCETGVPANARHEIELALAAAGHLFEQIFPHIGWEEELKRKKANAKYLWHLGRQTEAIRVLEALVAKSWLTGVCIPEEAQEGLPGQVSASLLVALADQGLFLDSHRQADARKGDLRCLWRPDGWVLVEEDRAYTFVWENCERFSVHYHDIDTIICLHLWRWEAAGPLAAQEGSDWLLELEEKLQLLPHAGLYHHLIVKWCETGDVRSAWRVAEAALAHCSEDSQLLQDAAFLCHELGWHDQAAQWLKASTQNAVRQILAAPPVTRFSAEELLRVVTSNLRSGGEADLATEIGLLFHLGELE